MNNSNNIKKSNSNNNNNSNTNNDNNTNNADKDVNDSNAIITELYASPHSGQSDLGLIASTPSPPEQTPVVTSKDSSSLKILYIYIYIYI